MIIHVILVYTWNFGQDFHEGLVKLLFGFIGPAFKLESKNTIMYIWWQTEKGMHMIAPLPVTPLKPGSATKALPGIDADVVDDEGNPVPLGKGGLLVIKKPWPAMLRTG